MLVVNARVHDGMVIGNPTDENCVIVYPNKSVGLASDARRCVPITTVERAVQAMCETGAKPAWVVWLHTSNMQKVRLERARDQFGLDWVVVDPDKEGLRPSP